MDTRAGSHHGISYTLNGTHLDPKLKEFYWLLTLELPETPGSRLAMRRSIVFEIKGDHPMAQMGLKRATETAQAFCAIAAREYGTSELVAKYTQKGLNASGNL